MKKYNIFIINILYNNYINYSIMKKAKTRDKNKSKLNNNYAINILLRHILFSNHISSSIF